MSTDLQWNVMASRYHHGSLFKDHIEIPALSRHLSMHVPGQHVLDLGCGFGRYARLMNDCGAQVTGVDIAEDMIVQAQTTVPTARFFQAPAQDLSCLGDTQFDCVVAVFLFCNLPAREDVRRVLREIRAHLKPGGRLTIYDMHPHFIAPVAHHPLVSISPPQNADYYWEGMPFTMGVLMSDGEWIRFTNYHWSFHAWFAELSDAGFSLRSFVEPEPVNVADADGEKFALFRTHPATMLMEWQLA